MKTVNKLNDELSLVRQNNADAFGVFYQSASNPSNYHYVIVRSEQEFQNLKQSYREWDFKFTKLAI